MTQETGKAPVSETSKGGLPRAMAPFTSLDKPRTTPSNKNTPYVTPHFIGCVGCNAGSTGLPVLLGVLAILGALLHGRTCTPPELHHTHKRARARGRRKATK